MAAKPHGKILSKYCQKTVIIKNHPIFNKKNHLKSLTAPWGLSSLWGHGALRGGGSPPAETHKQNKTTTSSPKRSIASQTDSASPGAALASTCAKSRSSFAYGDLGSISDARTLFWGGGGRMRNGPTAPPQAAHNRLLKLFYFREKIENNKK